MAQPARYALICGSTALALSALPSAAQQANAPQQVPMMDLPMQGSQWPQSVTADAEAPDVLLIMTDDVGYGASSTFGGPVPTPTFDALADEGLRYTQFTTTGICSPTRAALLTGRNHNVVNMGNVADAATGFDGYTSVIPDSTATGVRLLRVGGYATAMFGKGHITPLWETGPNGPFDHWPTGLGFQYFYGFLGGDTNQWAPAAYENTLPVEGVHGEMFEQTMADKAIGWMRKQKGARPNQPFFIYYAPGTAHAPHHAPADWIAKFRGQFDDGWDAMRERTLARQKELGIVPADTQLAKRPDEIPAWDSLTDRQKRIYAREMEVYAAALSYADYQVGRVIEEARARSNGNLMVVYIQGDNGGSAEGGADGTLNEHGVINGVTNTLDQLEAGMDDMGGPQTLSHYSAGWAFATTTPFPWFKQIASHFGATRNGAVISWPGHMTGEGGLRSQYHHVTDIMPTILEAAKVSLPDAVDGVKQRPFDGVSMEYSFDAADAPSHRTSQYYEIWDNAAIYDNGWVAATRPRVMPWVFGADAVFAADVQQTPWELYNINEDFSEARDLAAQYPERLAELKAKFFDVAAANNALPVHRSEGVMGRPDYTAGITSFTFVGAMDRLPPDVGPQIAGRSFDLTTSFAVGNDAPASGTIWSNGGRFGGMAINMVDGVPLFTYNFAHQQRTELMGTEALTSGNHAIRLEFRRGQGWRTSATAALWVDGKQVGTAEIPQTTMLRFSLDEGMDIGSDTGTPVSDRVESPARFNGTIGKTLIELR